MTGTGGEDLTSAQRALLEQRLRGRQEPNGTASSNDGAGRPPLSWVQEATWYVRRLAPDAPAYQDAVLLRRSGPLDIDALRRAFDVVVARHEAWRTRFPFVDGTVVQEVLDPAPAEFTVLDLRAEGAAGSGAAMQELGRIARALFDPERDRTLIRPVVVQLAGQETWLCLCLHYLMFDCAGLARVVIPELLAAYTAFAAGEEPNLPPVVAQYADYTRWERAWVDSPAVARRLTHWQQHLADADELSLPLDRPRRSPPRMRGAAEAVNVPAPLVDRLRTLGAESGASLFQVLAAGYATMLHRVTGQNDIVFGTVTDLRRRQDLENVVGYAMSPVPLRLDFSGHPTFAQTLARTREETLVAVDMAVPYPRLVRDVRTSGDGTLKSLMQAVLVQAPSVSLPEGWDVDLSNARLADHIGAATIDLQVEFEERPDGSIRGRAIYDADLFDSVTIQKLLGVWRLILEAATEGGDADVDLPTFERARAGPATIGRGTAERGALTDAPTTPLEHTLAALWAAALDRDTVGIHEDFFAAGGKSLQALALVERIAESVGREVPIAWLVAGGTTVAGMADCIEHGGPRRPDSSDAAPQHRLVVVWPNAPALMSMRHLRDRVGSTTEVISLVPNYAAHPGLRLDDLVDALVEETYDHAPEGPYGVAGFCLGGVLCYELAGRLRADGHEVTWLGVLDTPTIALDHESARLRRRIARFLERDNVARRIQLGELRGRIRRRRAARQGTTNDPYRVWAPMPQQLAADRSRRGHDIPMQLLVSDTIVWHHRRLALGWDSYHRGALEVHRAAEAHDGRLEGAYVEELVDELATHFLAATVHT
jgi:thioesterase domain-containing protein